MTSLPSCFPTRTSLSDQDTLLLLFCSLTAWLLPWPCSFYDLTTCPQHPHTFFYHLAQVSLMQSWFRVIWCLWVGVASRDQSRMLNETVGVGLLLSTLHVGYGKSICSFIWKQSTDLLLEALQCHHNGWDKLSHLNAFHKLANWSVKPNDYWFVRVQNLSI